MATSDARGAVSGASPATGAVFAATDVSGSGVFGEICGRAEGWSWAIVGRSESVWASAATRAPRSPDRSQVPVRVSSPPDLARRWANWASLPGLSSLRGQVRVSSRPDPRPREAGLAPFPRHLFLLGRGRVSSQPDPGRYEARSVPVACRRSRRAGRHRTETGGAKSQPCPADPTERQAERTKEHPPLPDVPHLPRGLAQARLHRERLLGARQASAQRRENWRSRLSPEA